LLERRLKLCSPNSENQEDYAVSAVQLKQLIQKQFNTLGYQLSKFHEPIDYPYLDVLDLILKTHRQDDPDFFFIQIGAADGVSEDPIYQFVQQFHWRGVLVEPQQVAFQQLVTHYQQEPQLAFENALIGDKDGETTLYAVPDRGENFHCWVYQCASQDRTITLRSLQQLKATVEPRLPDDYESLVQAIHVPSLTIHSLLKKYAVAKLDLLVLDTMGYDFEILKLFPFERLKPTIIHFEHNTLSLTDQVSCFRYLAQQGYALCRVSVDTIAYLNAPIRTGRYALAYT
jgi:FkbM family methyltransferase